jgi:hypothetical protein
MVFFFFQKISQAPTMTSFINTNHQFSTQRRMIVVTPPNNYTFFERGELNYIKTMLLQARAKAVDTQVGMPLAIKTSESSLCGRTS